MVDDDLQPTIYTARLELHHLSVPNLFKLFDDPRDKSIYEGCDYSNPHDVLVDDPGPLRWRVPQAQGDPTLNRWFVRWMVDRASRDIIGSASFHGAPSENGTLEIGLGVHPLFQAQGYGPESLVGMWSWACEQPDVRTLRYTVSPTNTASVKVVERFGFARRGVQIDDIDGPETIYEMSARDFLSRLAIDWRTGSSL